MLDRALAIPLHRAAQRGLPLLVQGPRGSGKTTLLRREFPAHTYVALDDTSDRAHSRIDPAGFLARLRGPAFLDDLHRSPELIAYLASAPDLGRLVLASSRRLTLPFRTLELHRPTLAERQRRPALALAMLGHFAPTVLPVQASPPPWPMSMRFLNQDIRDLVNVRELDSFESFLDLALAQSGEILDQQALARAAGVSHRTVVRWFLALDACFLTLRLAPAEVESGRRIIRAPKLHFLDSPNFESQVVSEIYRNARHADHDPALRYWRDSNGFEISLVIFFEGFAPLPVSITEEPNPFAETRLRRWMELVGVSQGALIAAATRPSRRGGVLRYAATQL
ncbi:MAG: hypothetical protein NTV52_11215 [Acidobacteria bacterium]|nr:hypothetical protein [Acidobacteriota bacterium]